MATPAFSFGIFPGAMTDLVVAPGVSPANGRGSNELITLGGNRHYQRGRRNPRTWSVSRPWQSLEFARVLGLAAHGLGGDMLLYDRAVARQNLIPATRAVGDGLVRRNLATNPSFEAGIDQGWGTAAGGGATIAADTEWAATGTTSVKVSGGTNAATSFYPFGTLTGQMERVGLIPGNTYTVGATIRLSAAQTDTTLDVNARGIVVSATVGGITQNVYAASASAANAAGVTRLAVSFTVPSAATNVYVRLMNGGVTSAVWWDSLTLENGVTDGSYFDGSTAPGLWEGAVNASPSLRAVAVAGLPMVPVTWKTITVPVLAGRTYTISAWAASGSPLTATVPGGAATAMPAVTGGVSTRTFTAASSGYVTLTRAAQVTSGVRIHEGTPDGTFYATEGTPTTVAVKDPERTYQLVTDTDTRIDYTVELLEVGTYPGAITY